MIWAVSLTINRNRASAANPFPVIGVERDWFVTGSEQIFVENIEHLEKRRVRRNVADFVLNAFAAELRVALSPDPHPEVHSWNREGQLAQATLEFVGAPGGRGL